MPKNGPPDGFSIIGYDPQLGDTCEWERQRKIGGRWASVACGEKAHVIIRLVRGELGPRLDIKLCRGCNGTMAKELITYLE